MEMSESDNEAFMLSTAYSDSGDIMMDTNDNSSYLSFHLEKEPEPLQEEDIFSESDESDEFTIDDESFHFDQAESEEEDFALLLLTTKRNNISNLELLNNYNRISEYRASLLTGQVENTFKTGIIDMHAKATSDRDMLLQEAYTWDLVRTLEQERENFPQSSWDVTSPERNACILKWLENIAKKKAENTTDRVLQRGPYDSICEKTSSTSNLSSSKDDFMKLLWICIRSGNLAAAEEFCAKCNQFWRFGSLNGGKFTSSKQLTGVWEGNPHRNLWKKCCWKLAEHPSFSDYERALYASRCGHLLQMFKVCQCWQDYLWACFRVLVDSYEDNQLATDPPKSFVEPDTAFEEPKLPLEQGCLSIEEVFTRLQDNSIVTTDKFELIQGYIIKQEFCQIFESVATWSKQETLSPILLRFVSHLLLYYRTNEDFIMQENKDIGDSIILLYINHLENQFLSNDNIPELDTETQDANEDSFRMKKARAIALYTSLVTNQERQVEIFANFLVKMKDSTENEKEIYWRYAVESSLDRERITNRVFQLTENNRKQDALDWLFLDANQRPDAVFFLNQLLREAILKDDLKQCNFLVKKLKEDSFEIIRRMDFCDSNEVRNACREYFCLDLYVSCQNLYNEWKQELLNPSSSNVIGEVAISVAKETQKNKLVGLAQRFFAVADMMLKFPPARINAEYFVEKYDPLLKTINQFGWFVDEYESNDPSRGAMATALRSHCIPIVVLELEEILYQAGDFVSVVRMAEWITDRKWKIYQSFTPTQVQELLRRIRKASLRLLESSSDPLGMIGMSNE